MKKYQFFIKRTFDICAGTFGLIVSLPFILIGMLIVKINSPESSVFFKQKRAGLYEKPFYIHKLRSMTNEYGKDGKLLADELRLQEWGIFLRRTCIDELPSFIDVINGNMSMVGPRPLPVSFVEQCTKEQRKRWNMKPGIASLQTAIGTNKTVHSERFKRDVWYVENFSLWVDCKMLILTLLMVIKRPFRKGEELSCKFVSQKAKNDD